MSNILLITNNQDIIKTFDSKLILLRDTDKMTYCDYEDAPDIIFSNQPDVVVLHENDDFIKTINLIKYAKTQNCRILLLINKYDRNNILSAYDEGIADYFSITSDPSEILIRTINCIKSKNTEDKISEYMRYLNKYGIIAESTGFYSKKYYGEIFENELLTKNYTQGSLIILAPSENTKTYSSTSMVSAIKKAIRYNDLVANISNGGKFCVLSQFAGAEGAIAIIQKISDNLGDQFGIKAGVCEIKNYTYKIAEKKALCALTDALLSNNDIVIYAKNKTNYEEDWLETPKKSEKNYKIFQQAFNKKLESIITPVFYRMQKDYEEKLTDTKIEQYTDELQCLFRLSNEQRTSILKILYSGFTKISIFINHSGLDSPENRELTLSVKELTTQNLTEILENFIKEFQTAI